MKQKWTHRYRKQTYGYQRGGGVEAECIEMVSMKKLGIWVSERK